MSAWLESAVQGVMLDITGVLYESGAGAIPGSVAATHKLRENGFKVILVSNESSLPTAELVAKLHALGFDWVTPSDVRTPVPAVVDVIKQEGLNPHLLVADAVEEDFSGLLRPSEPPSCVVVGDAEHKFSFEHMNKAFNYLMNMNDPKLFTLGKGRYYQHKGSLQLDLGAFTAALEYATGVTAVVVGKPGPLYYQGALQHLGLSPSQVVMVGDDLYGDIIGSSAVGCRAVLVRTGKFQTEWAEHPAPAAVVDCLATAVDLLVKAKKNW